MVELKLEPSFFFLMLSLQLTLLCYYRLCVRSIVFKGLGLQKESKECNGSLRCRKEWGGNDVHTEVSRSLQDLLLFLPRCELLSGVTIPLFLGWLSPEGWLTKGGLELERVADSNLGIPRSISWANLPGPSLMISSFAWFGVRPGVIVGVSPPTPYTLSCTHIPLQ